MAAVILAGGIPLWCQQPAEVVRQDPSELSLSESLRSAGWMVPGVTSALTDPESSPPDATSALADARLSERDSSSVVPPASQPDFGGGAAPVVRSQQPLLPSQKFHWGPALRQSLLFLGVEHGFRMTQLYTRKRLAGPFFQDWFDSVGGTSGWGDNDAFSANYIGHPMQGAISSYIHIQNDPGGIYQEFGRDPAYWKSRLRAMVWAAAYSVQFELGPLSEASIGNVGQKKGTAGAVDLVVTPTAGFGWTVTEDLLDRYVILGLERRNQNRVLRGFARSLLNPSRSFANLMRAKPPWHRDTRGGVAAADVETPQPTDSTEIGSPR